MHWLACAWHRFVSGCADFRTVVQPSLIHINSFGLFEEGCELADTDLFGVATGQHTEAAELKIEGFAEMVFFFIIISISSFFFYDDLCGQPMVR